MENSTIAEYARRGFWTLDDILNMADEDSYLLVYGIPNVWPSDNWLNADWLTENGTEDLRFFSYHVVLFRRSQHLAIIQLRRMIGDHVEAGSLPSKIHSEGVRIFNPHEFKSWWFKHDMKTYVEQLGFASSSPLYEVFEGMEKIDGTNRKSPPEENEEKVGKTEKANKNKIQDSLPRPTDQLLVDTVDKSEAGKKPKAARGRPSFPYSSQFVKAVKAQHKKGIPENEIPFMAPVTRTFAKDTPNQGMVIDKEDYIKTYRWSLRKVRENVQKALSE